MAWSRVSSTSAADLTQDAPSQFICPITCQIMRDPVLCADGFTYERSAIEQWLRDNSSSPMTRQALPRAGLTPNLSLRQLIEDFIETKRQAQVQALGPTSSRSQHQTHEAGQDQNTIFRDQERVSDHLTQPLNVRHIVTDTELGLHITAPEGSGRVPLDLCCIIDVSGSMSAAAVIQNDEGHTESYGLSVLDVVKHAVRTVMSILNDKDRLSLVAYSDEARTALELTSMTQSNRCRAMKHLDEMSASGRTNLWAGLKMGLESMKEASKLSGASGRHRAVLLLTDGKPNVMPPRGHMQTLEKFIAHNGLPCTIETFGFGYEMDSELLQQLARRGGGSYAFIPDSGMVGTVFVHAVSNLLTTAIRDVEVVLQATQHHPEAAGIFEANKRLPGGFSIKRRQADIDSGGQQFIIQVGCMTLAQTRTIIVPLVPGDAASEMSIAVRYHSTIEGRLGETVAAGEVHDEATVEALEIAKLRLRLVDALFELASTAAASSPGRGKRIVQSLQEAITASPAAASRAAAAMLEDVQGQVQQAVSREDWYNRWGRHFLPSLAFAHLRQVCNNFKDPGVQLYGGQIFEEIRDHADDVFCTLPPPKPSKASAAYGCRRVQSSARSRSGRLGQQPTGIRALSSHATTSTCGSSNQISMSLYHSRSAPCFTGASIVDMADGSRRHVQDIRKGDVVAVPSRCRSVPEDCSSAEVVCVVVTPSRAGRFELTSLTNGLKITPYHPVWLGADESWKFPLEVATTEEEECDRVFSFVLSSGHVMSIGGVACATLGHGFNDNKVIAHPFYGTAAVIECLSKMTGWQEGLITLPPDPAIRDPESGLVCDLRPPSKPRNFTNT